jgi:hypothetical protein
LDPASEGDLDSVLRQSSMSETEAPLLTLDDILSENNIPPSQSTVLKMDCEGCEYDTILSCASDTIRRFGYIQIEYHFGYKDLKEKLEKSGFRVSVTTPEYLPSRSLIETSNMFTPKSGKTLYIGYLYAERI